MELNTVCTVTVKATYMYMYSVLKFCLTDQSLSKNGLKYFPAGKKERCTTVDRGKFNLLVLKTIHIPTTEGNWKVYWEGPRGEGVVPSMRLNVNIQMGEDLLGVGAVGGEGLNRTPSGESTYIFFFKGETAFRHFHFYE